VAARGVQEDVIARTRAALVEAGALKPPPGEGTPPYGTPSEDAATVSNR
jgi:hypothetical protein